ncbi:MAG: ABC transporter ATP-binding protein [Clostridia bacterium]|nr:ABC transporter ATP-binding protein [Clostridia bacterium]
MKKKNKVSVIKDLKKIVKLSGKSGVKYIVLVILQSAADGLGLPIIAYFSKYIIDYAINKNRTDLLISIGLIIGQIVLMVLNSILNYYISKQKYIIGMNIKRRMFAHFVNLPVAYFEKAHSGDTIARINGDTDLFLNSLDMVYRIISNFMSTIIAVPAILVLDIRMGLLAGIVGTLSAYINKKFRVPIRKQNETLRKQVSIVLTEIIENISGFKVIKTYNLQEHFKNRFFNKQEEIIKTKKKKIVYSSSLYSLNSFIYQFNNSAVLIYGTYLIIKGLLTIGDLAALRQLGVRIGYLLIDSTESFSKAQDAFAGSDRVLEFLNQPVEKENIPVSGKPCDSLICLDDVYFSYIDGSEVLKGISIDIKKGEKVALVGYSGHGKSTIVKLMLGLYDFTEGTYTFEGRSACDYTKKQIRRKVSYVSQNATIFNGTIKENILNGKLEATDEEVIEAAKKAHAHEFIIEQEKQYDTVVGERGIKLSGGQRQRVALARAILKNGEILILDEATSSLDSKSEEFIKDSLDQFMKDRTNIIVAHRLSTVENSDMIYLIEDGRVEEKGTHQELLSLNGKYSKLYYKDFI